MLITIMCATKKLLTGTVSEILETASKVLGKLKSIC